MKYFVRISVRNWCRNKNRGRSSFLWNCCYSNLPNPHGKIRIATFSNKTTSTSISISAPQKYANRCTVIHHYTDTYKRREDNIKMKYFVRISVGNWCRNKNRGRSSFVWNCCYSNLPNPHGKIRIATYSDKTTSTSISISAPQKYANRCTVIHHYTHTYKRREDNIKNEIFCKNKCKKLV